MSGANEPFEIDALWEYGDPAESERRFRAAIEDMDARRGAKSRGGADAPGDTTPLLRLELLTQIARTLGLRRRFDEAHAQLDEVDAAMRALERKGGAGADGDLARVRARLLLERGRVFNSSGDPVRARAPFEDAWALASASAGDGGVDPILPGLAVDAAHMIAITQGGTASAIEWNERGLALARRSPDAKALGLVPAMLNNSAWDLHGLGRHEEALARFEEARAAWTERGREPQMRIARWSVARCLRSLGRHSEALEILRALEREPVHPGANPGFVLEEIAENLAALDRGAEARPYFRGAAEELAKLEWLARGEPGRLASLVERGREP